VDDEAGALGFGGDPLGVRLGAGLVGGSTPMEGDDRALVLDPEPGSVELGGVEARRETGGIAAVRTELRRGPRLGRVRRQQLEPVVADVGQLLEPDDLAGQGRPAAADDRGDGKAVGDSRQRHSCLVGNPGLLRPRDDRRQGPVEIGEDGSTGRVVEQRSDRRHWSGVRHHSSSIAPCPGIGRSASPRSGFSPAPSAASSGSAAAS
jgi:hypothetical protein